ncbi:MAG: LCP family protein [Acidimicrobiia bacterium]
MAKHLKPSPLGAGIRSLILPGWGQLATAQRRLGWTLIALSLLVVGVGALLFLKLGPVELAARLSDPDTLMLLVVANLAIALARAASSAHAWWAKGGQRRLVPLLLVLVAVAPHAVVAWAGLTARGTLIEVFAAAPPVTAETAASSTTTTTMPPGPVIGAMAPLPFSIPQPTSEDALPMAFDELTAPVSPRSNIPFGGKRTNILLLGGDAGPGRSGIRTDSIIVASIDPTSGTTALFSLPRNWGGFTFSDGTPYSGSLLNTVYAWGLRNPEAFRGPYPGAAAIGDVVEYLTGLPIDYFALVDLTGFADLIDVLGGVTMKVDRHVSAPIYDPHTGTYEMIELDRGVQKLTGAEALGYVRVRRDSSDYRRMARQRCFLAALAKGADPIRLLTNLGDILETVERNVTTDFPLDLVPDLIRLIPKVSASNIRVIGFDASWTSGVAPTGGLVPEVDRVREAVLRTLIDPDSADDLGATTASSACE